MIESEPRTEQNRSEQIASKMYDISDRIEQPKDHHEALTNAAIEFASGAYDKGQRILEKNGFWQDDVRGATVEANQVEEERRNVVPLNFAEAKNSINGYAKSLNESGDREDKKSALDIESIVRGTERPGVEGIDDALKYIEGVLKTKANLERQMTPEMKKQWDEQRAIRDALFIEKQRRVEQVEQARQMKNRPVMTEKSKKQIKEQDKGELDRLRISLGLDEETRGELPTDEKSLIRYYKDKFGKIENVPLEEFKKQFTPDVENNFRAWISQHVKTMIEGKPANVRSPDTVATVLGNDEPLLQRIVSLKEGRVIDMDKLLRMPFSEVAKEYLNIELPKNYSDNFSPR